MKKGLSGEGWVTMQACYLTNYNNAPVGYGGGSPVNPHNGKDELFPVVWDRRSALTAPTGYKGVSSLFQWLGTSRSVGDTITKITSKDKIVIGHLIADWDGTLPEV